MNRTVSYLPMPKKRSKLEVTAFAALADPEMAARAVQAADATRRERVRAEAARWPSRVLANALVNTAWRNGPVENVHAGGYHGYPLDQRRGTPTEERELMAFTSGRLALGMTVCLLLAMERPQRPWSEQVLPYGLAEILMLTPSRWTLTETPMKTGCQSRPWSGIRSGDTAASWWRPRTAQRCASEGRARGLGAWP